MECHEHLISCSREVVDCAGKEADGGMDDGEGSDIGCSTDDNKVGVGEVEEETQGVVCDSGGCNNGGKSEIDGDA